MASLRETIPLQRKKVFKKSLGGMIGVLFLAGFLSVPLYLFDFVVTDIPDVPAVLITIASVDRVAVALVLLILFCSSPVYEYFYWKRYFYDMDDNNIIIRKGVIALKEITLPFSRITDVYVDQDIFDVMFGLYDVHISTPTQESGLFAHIDGINKEGSEQLRQLILDRVNKNTS